MWCHLLLAIDTIDVWRNAAGGATVRACAQTRPISGNSQRPRCPNVALLSNFLFTNLPVCTVNTYGDYN